MKWLTNKTWWGAASAAVWLLLLNTAAWAQ
jgi:hypothetical protein